jgi:hypothetical protein
MSFVPQLSVAELTTLRGNGSIAPTYTGATYVSVLPDVTVFQAQINQTVFGASYASVTFDNVVVGSYLDIIDGMTVYITPTTDLRNAIRTGFIGRARLDGSGVVATSTVLYINENSTAIQNNWIITIKADYRIWDRLGRQDDTTDTQYIDYNVPFRLPKPVIYSISEVYASWVTGGVYSIDFTPLAFAVTSGASIVSWLWDVIDGSITSGTSTTQNITAEFPAGFRHVFLTVTDSNGSTRTRKIKVFAHDPDTYPPVPLQVGDLQVQATIEGGYSASMSAWAGVSSILDNTFIAFWSVESYQDYSGSLLGNNINFSGRFRQSNDSSTPDLGVGQLAETRYTVEGVMQQMARIEMLPYELDNTGVATSFFQVVNLTAWRAVCEMFSNFSTFLETNSLSFDSIDNTFIALGFRTQNGNILAVVNDLYNSIDGAMQINTSSDAQFVRDLRMLGDSARNAAVTAINYDSRDLLSIDDYAHDNVKMVGRLKASGGSYQSAVSQYITFESLAPGVAQDYPEASQSLDRQVLQADVSAYNAQNELNTRAGYALARAQNADKISVTHPDGYASILVPSLDTWYTFTLDGTQTVRDIILTSATRWLLVSVDITHNAQTGEKECKAVYTIETTGAAGQSVVYPPSQDAPYTDPSFPPFDAFPAFPTDPSYYLPPDTNIMPFVGNPTVNQTVIPADGNTVLQVDYENNIVMLTTNYITGGRFPTWIDITPPNAIGQYVKHAIFDAVTKAVYVLYSDNENSTVAYCANPYAAPPTWVETALTGVYDTLKAGDSAGELYVKGKAAGGTLAEWTVELGTETARGVDGFGQPYIDIDEVFHSAFGGYGLVIATGGDSICCTLVQADITGGSQNLGGSAWSNCGETYSGVDGSWPHSSGFPNTVVGENIRAMRLTSITPISWRLTFDTGCVSGTIAPATVYSSNFAATFSTPQPFGVEPSLGSGLDTIKIGSVALVGSSGQVEKATNGGAYSPYGTLFPSGAQPNGLWIPRYAFGGTVTGNISTSNPQYLAASGTLSGSGQALWKVTSSGSLFTNITPFYNGTIPGLLAGTFGGAVTMPYRYGTRILEVAKFNGTPRLAVTVNTGSTWKFSDPLNSDANYIRTRKAQGNQAFIANGTISSYIADYTAATLSLVSKFHPSGGRLRSIEVYGG